MKRILLFSIALLISSSALFSQQNILPQQAKIYSPIINKDKTVSLYLKMPNAKSVEVKGDWMKFGTTGKMTKDAEGLWSYTSDALSSDLYIYQFIVDGTTIIDPLNVYQIRDVSSLFSYFVVEGGLGDLYQTQKVPHGTFAKCWYDSPSLSTTRRLSVYTPSGYNGSRSSYPVLYLLHGMGGDEDAWPTLGRVAEIMDNLIASGKCKPMIVVMPNGNVSQEAAPGASSKGQPQIDFFLPRILNGEYEHAFKDIIGFVEKNYRVKKDKSGRAIAGLSMGGAHSLFISANYPNTFDYVGLFSAATSKTGSIKTINSSLDEGYPYIYEDIDMKLKAQKDNGFKLYWIGMGVDDFLFQEMAEYRKKLDAINFPYQYEETSKGHVWSNWRMYLSEFVQLIFND